MKKLLLVIVLISLTSFANAQWIPTNGPYFDPPFNHVTQVNTILINGDNIFVGTGTDMAPGGGVYITSDNGNNWINSSNGLDENLEVYSLISKDSDIFAAIWGDAVRYSSNNGSSWVATNLSSETFSLAVKGDTLFAGADLAIYFSSDDGISWDTSNILVNKVMAFAFKDDYIFAGTDFGVFLSSDNGISWTAMNSGFPSYYTAVYALAISGNNIYAGTNYGVYLSSNNGGHWTAVNTGLTDTIVKAFAISGSNIFAGTWSGVFLSSDNGNNWSSNGITTRKVLSLAIKGDTLFAGTDSLVWKSSLSQLTGISEINNDVGNINVYPNPATDIITIKSLQKSEIQILNVQGQTILRQSIQQGKTDITLCGLAKGLYILRLNYNDKTEMIKFLKE